MQATWRGAASGEPTTVRELLTRAGRMLRGWVHKARGDAALLRLAQTGDTLAFSELVGRFRDRIYALALESLKNPEQASDVVCEVFVTAYRRLGWFDRSCSPGTWFHLLALGAVLDRTGEALGSYRVERSRPA